MVVLKWKWYQSHCESQEWSWRLRNFCGHSGKKCWVCSQSLFHFLVPNQTNWLDPVFMDLQIFLLMLFFIELIFPERTCCCICLILSMAVYTFEGVWTWFAFFGFEVWRINSIIHFAAPSEFAVIFWLVRSITLYTFWVLNSARESQMTPLPTVFTLRNTRVRISHSNHRNIPSNIETLINKTFSLDSTLCVPNVDPHNGHIRLWWYFDYPRFGGKGNVVEDMILLYNVFSIIWCDVLLEVVASMWIIWDADDLEVQLWLW